MFLLRRTAARAVASTSATGLFVKPRSISSIAPAAFRLQKQQWTVPAFQRRFTSDEAVKTPEAEAASEAASEAGFAQTAAEAPVQEDLTPAQEGVQAQEDMQPEPATSSLDALEEAAATPAPRSRSRTGEPAPPNNQLYVGNLYYEVTADQLNRVFSRFGEIESSKVIYDNRGLSRGFGYVEFKNMSDAQAAMENLDMQVFEGRNLVVQFHKAKEASKTRTEGGYVANAPSKTLFIGNMSFEMSDKDLNDLFRDIRNVMDVRVAIDRRTGQPRGFAHADFIDVASATKAKEVLGEKIIYGRQLRIDYSRSSASDQPKGDRRGDRRDRRDDRRDRNRENSY